MVLKSIRRVPLAFSGCHWIHCRRRKKGLKQSKTTQKGIKKPDTGRYRALNSGKINVLQRERDSNPRTCYSQWFSRPPQSTTLPSLFGDTKVRRFLRQRNTKALFPKKICARWLYRTSRNLPCPLSVYSIDSYYPTNVARLSIYGNESVPQRYERNSGHHRGL